MNLKNAPNSLSISWNTFSPTSLNYSNTDLHKDHMLEQHEEVQIWYTGIYLFYFNSHLSSSGANKNLFIPKKPEKMHFLLIQVHFKNISLKTSMNL